MNKNTIDPVKSIPAFYAGQSIFLTGATGFLGKVYIEKILRSCPDVREIFILMRPKKGLSLNERLEKMLNLPLYDRLRKEQPSNFKKIILISGNTSQENLGLSAIDRQILIDRVTIIIHNAASVKFNDSLKYAILTNTRSTRDICILAENMKNLVALVYVSTAYTHIYNPHIEEKTYPPAGNWREMIKIAETIDEHILNILTAKSLNNMLNTYIFSKNLAESIIEEYSSSLPCAIVRPSMVMGIWKEPLLGWIDNFNGPMGLYSIAGHGLLQVLYASNSTALNFIPIDIVINAIILATWKLGLTTSKSTTLVINITVPKIKYISFREFSTIVTKISEEVPFELLLWTTGTLFIENSFMFYVLTILWHILPAIFMDLLLKLSGRRPMVLNVQKKMYVTNKALQHFLTTEYTFENTQCQDIMSIISCDDREMFSIDLFDVDITNYLRTVVIGTKKYLIHDDMNRLDTAKAHRKKVDFLVLTFRTIIAIGILWMIYKWICF